MHLDDVGRRPRPSLVVCHDKLADAGSERAKVAAAASGAIQTIGKQPGDRRLAVRAGNAVHGQLFRR